MTTLKPGESRDFFAKDPGEIKSVKVDIRFDPFDEPAIVLAFLGGNIAFGWLFGSLLAALI